MNDEEFIREALNDLKVLAPSGYALAFQIEFTTPTFLFQSYPKEWIRQYSEKGLVMSDPTVHWGFENEGFVRWSDLLPSDSAEVLKQASDYGLKYGLTCSVNFDGERSFASFARDDREFSDDEASVLLGKVDELHTQTAKIRTASPEATQALQRISVDFSA